MKQKKRRIRDLELWQLKKRLNYLASKSKTVTNEMKYIKFHIRKRGRISKLVKRIA